MRLRSFFPVGQRFNNNVVLEQIGPKEFKVKCDCGNIRVLVGCTSATLRKVKRCKECFKKHSYSRKKKARNNKVTMRFDDKHYDTLYTLASKGCYRSIPEMCCQLVLKQTGLN